MTVFNNRLLVEEEEKDPEVLKWQDDLAAFAEKHPMGIDLGSNEKEIETIRAARRSVKGKGMKLARPEMPSGGPSDFRELASAAPPMRDQSDVLASAQGPEVSQSQTRTAADRTSGDSAMRDAQMYDGGRRARGGMAQAARMIGRAGLEQSPATQRFDQDFNADGDRAVKGLNADRSYAQKQLEEGRAVEDQSFQREQVGFQREERGEHAEKAGRERDHHDPKSGVSGRRRAELMGIYGKEIAKIPFEDFSQLSAADVDVLFKELDMKHGRDTSARGAAAMERAFAQQVKEVGVNTAKLPYGEIDQLAQRLEAAAPGITTGQYKGSDPLGGFGNRAAMALPGGVGERFADSKSMAANKAIGELIDLISRLRTGAVINESEEAHYKSLIGSGVMQDGRSMGMGVKTVMDSIRSKLKNMQSGYDYLRNDKGQSPLDVVSGKGATDYRSGAPGGRQPQRKQGKDGKWYRNDGSGWESE